MLVTKSILVLIAAVTTHTAASRVAPAKNPHDPRAAFASVFRASLAQQDNDAGESSVPPGGGVKASPPPVPPRRDAAYLARHPQLAPSGDGDSLRARSSSDPLSDKPPVEFATSSDPRRGARSALPSSREAESISTPPLTPQDAAFVLGAIAPLTRHIQALESQGDAAEGPLVNDLYRETVNLLELLKERFSSVSIDAMIPLCEAQRSFHGAGWQCLLLPLFGGDEGRRTVLSLSKLKRSLKILSSYVVKLSTPGAVLAEQRIMLESTLLGWIRQLPIRLLSKHDLPRSQDEAVVEVQGKRSKTKGRK